MRRLTFTIFFLLIVQLFFCQNKKIDSLLAITKSNKHDTIKSNTFLSLANQYIKLKDSLKINEAFKNAKQFAINYNRFYVSALRKEGVYYRKKAYYKMAYDTLLKAINICDKQNIVSLVGAYNDVGVSCRTTGDFQNAIQFGLKAAALIDNNPTQLDSNTKMNAFNSLANSYTAFGNAKKDTTKFTKALYFYNKAKKWLPINPIKKQEITTYAMIENNLGVVNGYIGKIVKSTDYFITSIQNHELALEKRVSIKDSFGILDSYSNLGVSYHDLAQAQSSIIYVKKAVANHLEALKISKLIGNDEDANITNNYMGELLLLNELSGKKDNLDEIMALGKYVMQKAQQSGDLTVLFSVKEHLSQAYEQKGDYKNSLLLMKQSIAIKDSILNEENNKTIEELSTKYESDKKDKENLLLKKETEAQNATLERQKVLNYAYVIGLVFIIIFIIMIYKNLSNSKKATKAITAQKHVIEEKQKEIIQSIEYAKRIQQSLLPTKKYINKNINKS